VVGWVGGWFLVLIPINYTGPIPCPVLDVGSMVDPRLWGNVDRLPAIVDPPYIWI
jgi:hypothetical protein